MIVTLVAGLLQLLIFFIFARAIISWFPIDRNGPIVRALDAVTEPILEPLRRVVPRIGMIDITPMVALILLSILLGAIQRSGTG
jgi:YggT family protein